MLISANVMSMLWYKIPVKYFKQVKAYLDGLEHGRATGNFTDIYKSPDDGFILVGLELSNPLNEQLRSSIDTYLKDFFDATETESGVRLKNKRT